MFSSLISIRSGRCRVHNCEVDEQRWGRRKSGKYRPKYKKIKIEVDMLGKQKVLVLVMLFLSGYGKSLSKKTGLFFRLAMMEFFAFA